ncbi:MAG TPA: hypothetical protein VH120_13410 [Gemmataceae bacterium]|nr:hypothetical protein [Gemmataceae bacterium]
MESPWSSHRPARPTGCRLTELHPDNSSAETAGEIFNLECGEGYTDSIVNNAFVWSHAYNCSVGGIVLYVAGIHDNFFYNLNLQTMSKAIYIDGFNGTLDPDLASLISNNRIENVKIGSNLYVTGALFGELRQSDRRPPEPAASRRRDPAALGYCGYTPDVATPNVPNYQGFLPFYDVSTHGIGESANAYHNLYLSSPNELTQVFCFPNIGHPNT